MKLRFPLQRPTSANGALLPAACSAALAVIALLQLGLTQPVELPQQGASGSAAQASLPRLVARPVPPILEKISIFAPERTAGGSGASGNSSQLGGHRLAGALSVRGRTVAILQGPDGTARRLPVGGAIGGMTLLGVDGDGATFRKDGKRIHVGFGRAAPAPGPQVETEETTQ